MKQMPALLAALALPGAALAGVCAPAQVVHIVTRLDFPKVDPGTFAAKPQGLYRLGSGKIRSEEAPDREQNIQGLSVINEPDIWMANLLDGTGRHIIDPGPELKAHAPIFAAPDTAAALLDLEFGCVAEFMLAHSAGVARHERLGEMTYDVRRLEDRGQAVELLFEPGTGKPVLARYFKDGALQVALRYELYETGLPERQDLFSAPDGIEYRDQK